MYYINTQSQQGLFPMLIKATFTLCLLWLSGCSQTANEASPEQQTSTVEAITLYKNAIIALNNDELKKAEQLFIQMTTIDADMAGPWANLALIKTKQNDYPQAKIYAQKALDKNPKMAQALNLSGTIALKQGKIKLAEQFYLQAISNKPNYALAHYNLALLNDIYLQDIAVAVKHYKLYLANNEQKDQQTVDWLESLEATLASSHNE